MKVLLIGPVKQSLGGTTAGGVATVCTNLLEGLAQIHDLDVHILALNAPCEDSSDWEEHLDNFHIYRPLNRTNNIVWLWKYLNLCGISNILNALKNLYNTRHKIAKWKIGKEWKEIIAWILYFQELIKNIEPDIIHIHHAHQYPVICNIASNDKRPLIITLHSFSGLVWDKNRYMKLYQASFQIAGKCIAISTAVKEQAMQLGLKPEKIELIPNAIDVDLFKFMPQKEARGRLRIDGHRKIILFVGGLTKNKGVDVLMKAFSKVRSQIRDSLLVYVGDGEEKNNLKNLAHQLDVANSVLFAGNRPNTELPLWYNACDVFILPSQSEGLSIALLEAMACANPVITTHPTIGKYDAIIENDTGLLTEYGNVEQLADKIISVLTNPDFSDKLGKSAAKIVREDFNLKVMCQRTYSLYRRVLKESSRELNNENF
ncbi:MAG: glycosyltransferase family 4 protein [Bacteroidetes bacterium]|nr:glycosyltransferase family 4 protein [Bacteroidota bacterium]